MRRKTRKCPNCNSRDTINIVYGEITEDIDERYIDSVLQLSEDEIQENSPVYKCNDCGYKWGRLPGYSHKYKDIVSVKTTICGKERPTYEVGMALTGGKCHYKFQDCDYKEAKTVNLEQIDKYRFISKVEDVRLLDWPDETIAESETSEFEWIVVIKTITREIIKKGRNKYPAEWSNYCKVLSDFSKKTIK